MEYATILESLKLDYAVLVEKFLYKSKPHVEDQPDALNELKSYYSEVINSARTFDYINNLEGLLRILEKRNELSYENIRPLIHIEASYVKSPELCALLRNYEENMRHSSGVPLFNMCDFHSGKYYIENINISKNPRLIVFASLNNDQLINRSNHDIIKMNQDTINVADAPEIPDAETFLVEGTLFSETHIFSCNNLPMFEEKHSYRRVGDSNIFIAKTQWRTTKYATILLELTFVAATIFMKLLISIFDARLSEHSHENQRDYSSRAQSNPTTSCSFVQAPMTLYTATEPSFRLTLPALVQINALRNSNYEDGQTARIVFLEISDNLGRHWRDVARFLGVTEHDIDEIDSQPQLPLKEKALKALTKFQSKSDPQQWKPKLQRALEKARRRDLMEVVEELWSRKYQPTS